MKDGKEQDSPKSTDLDGWKSAIEGGRLPAFRLEAIAAAFQDLGNRDTNVRNELAKYLSRAIIKIARQRIGSHHPNRGEDIIMRLHEKIIVALLRPESADGQSLRIAFVPRLLFRLKDAIADEEQEWIATECEQEPQEGEKRSKGLEEVPEVIPWAMFHQEQMEVDRILECISNPRKRLAFRLFMDGVPYKSKNPSVYTIAEAVGVSEKTARDWVEEVRHLLETDERVKFLKEEKAGGGI
jgi:hypothetical protein